MKRCARWRSAPLLAVATIAPAAALGAGGGVAAATAPLAYTCQVLGQTRDLHGRGRHRRAAPPRLRRDDGRHRVVRGHPARGRHGDDPRRPARGRGRRSGRRWPAGSARRTTAWTLGFVRTAGAGGRSDDAGDLDRGRHLRRRQDGPTWRIRTGDLNATLLFYRADGAADLTDPERGRLVHDAGRPALADQKITVVKDTTTTTVIGKDTAVGVARPGEDQGRLDARPHARGARCGSSSSIAATWSPSGSSRSRRARPS